MIIQLKHGQYRCLCNNSLSLEIIDVITLSNELNLTNLLHNSVSTVVAKSFYATVNLQGTPSRTHPVSTAPPTCVEYREPLPRTELYAIAIIALFPLNWRGT